MTEQISIDEFHRRIRAQCVSTTNHYAFICPICGTVQSMASLVAAGATSEYAEKTIGFSCEGRVTGAGPWPSTNDKSQKANERRKMRGCDWTLGGFFKLHALEVRDAGGRLHPHFEIATSEDAKALEGRLTELGEVRA